MTPINLGSRRELSNATLTEAEIAELYCQPWPYWRSVQFLLELPNGSFRFNELHRPKKWCDAISKYLELTGQGEVSRAAKQLFRLVEQARTELRDAQDRARGNRAVGEQTPEEYERASAP